MQLNGIGQDIWIKPGDFILADADGVVYLPRAMAPQVLELLPKLVAGISLAKSMS